MFKKSYVNNEGEYKLREGKKRGRIQIENLKIDQFE